MMVKVCDSCVFSVHLWMHDDNQNDTTTSHGTSGSPIGSCLNPRCLLKDVDS